MSLVVNLTPPNRPVARRGSGSVGVMPKGGSVTERPGLERVVTSITLIAG